LTFCSKIANNPNKVALNRFSIPKRLTPAQIKEICEKFNLTDTQFREGTVGRRLNFQLCAYICILLGYKDWYPKYWPKRMSN